MSDAGIIAIVSGYVSLVGVIAWLVYSRIAAANALQAMDDERDKAIVRAERAEFELGHTKDALADANRTIEALAKEPHEKPNSDLPAGDIVSRVRRAAEEARASRAHGVPDGKAAAVHSDETASDTAAAEVPHDPNGLMQPD